MLPTVEGVYRNGHVELAETPAGATEETRVLVTFVSAGELDLSKRGIDERQAAELRARLASFADDWDSPEMADYDDYDAKCRKLEAG